MNLQDRTVWQVGAGDGERRYDDICVKYDVAVVGPGYFGPFEEQLYAGPGNDSVRRFYKEAKKGDIVLLRLGTGQIYAVGTIEDDQPAFLEEFGHIDGWDLSHTRRVRWIPNTRHEFPAGTLGARVSPFARVFVGAVHEWLHGLEVAEGALRRDLATMPVKSKDMPDEELGRQLFIEGLASEYIDNLIRVLQSIRRVGAWYWNEEKRPRGRPSERETVTYLTVPLLFALGWSHQTAAIEWRGIDVALFTKMPPEDSTLACVVEAKTLDSSVFRAVGQARNYAIGEGREGCRRLVITDGIRYTYFEKDEEDFKLRAYMNILRMREQYPVYGCAGAVQAIMGMAR